jgi:pterin-4a-carbinolamine dehydratase
MKLAKLHETFINNARKPMISGDVPISPSTQNNAVLQPGMRWNVVKSGDITFLKRTYLFIEPDVRRRFVCATMDEERIVEHVIEMNVYDESVDVILWTRGLNSITNVDKELAKRIDELYIDMMYNSGHDKR